MNPKASDKESEWRVIVNQFKSSGLSQKEFSKYEGLSKTRLSYWVCKFREDSEPIGFLELPATSEAEAADVELEFPSGIKLRIRG